MSTSMGPGQGSAFHNCVLCRYEDLHQGLYLGFKGLRPLTTPQLQHLWHENSLVATTFTNVSNRTAPSTQSVSLFNLGELYTAAAKDVQYAAQNPGSTQSDGVSLALNRQWLFMQANGPGLLYESYLHSLDFMVRWLILQQEVHCCKVMLLA
eukprot:GHRR01035089.1.p1 GENE.GHRR01035089.1~~GHRR01035089.1.p1  ORF type:complete len:152 (-),score=42.19 GHRR01035089.1:13-468(-)